ncbi:MAG: Ppx/GppA phosphatase family protein [Cyanobacteria bacterium P01_F01_bin.33]
MVTATEASSPGQTPSVRRPIERVVAAIDVGTNSIHMVIVRINPELPSFTVLSSEKATVRLGEADGDFLTEAAMQRAYDALERCVTLAKTFQTEAIVATATSAVREASNGTDFLQRVERGLGLHVDLISGVEEARRIYLGVLSVMEFHDLPHVIIDIGGGSTELIVGDGQDPLFLRSMKIGAVRLTQRFLATDPPSLAEIERLRGYVQGAIELPVDAICELLAAHQPGEPIRLIGTSGTTEALAEVIARRQLGAVPSPFHGYECRREDLRNLVAEVSRQTIQERIDDLAMSDRRAEIIVAGAVILEEVMNALGADSVMICERALREGLIVDWMLSRNLVENRLRYQGSVRRRHAYKLAHKYRVNIPHAENVAELALSLFDQTRDTLHRWGNAERELLWVAAMLHNSGLFVSHAEHHKHSYYLIRHGELLGFSEAELDIVANLARYHRKSPPKKKHVNFMALEKERRQLVTELSPLLRLATALNRRRAGAIASVKVDFTTEESGENLMHLYITPTRPNDECSLELWSLEYKKEVFETQFALTLIPKVITDSL